MDCRKSNTIWNIHACNEISFCLIKDEKTPHILQCDEQKDTKTSEKSSHTLKYRDFSLI